MTTHLALIALFMTHLPAGEQGQVCHECAPGEAIELCLPHQKVEAEVLFRYQNALASEVDSIRITAVEDIAALTLSHINAPQERVAQVLVGQFESASFQVQIRVAELLAGPQHLPTVIHALTTRLGRLDGEVAGYRSQFDALSEELSSLNGPLVDPKLTSRSRKRIKAIHAELIVLVKPMMGSQALRSSLADTMGSIRDDRITDALAKGLLRQGGHTLSGAAISRALLQHGTRSAVSAFSKGLKESEKLHASYQKDLRECERARPLKRPKWWHRNRKYWEAQSRSILSKRKQKASDDLLRSTGVILQQMEELKAFGKQHEFSKAPRGTADSLSAWRRWLGKNRKLLPESFEP